MSTLLLFLYACNHDAQTELMTSKIAVCASEGVHVPSCILAREAPGSSPYPLRPLRCQQHLYTHTVIIPANTSAITSGNCRWRRMNECIANSLGNLQTGYLCWVQSPVQADGGGRVKGGTDTGSRGGCCTSTTSTHRAYTCMKITALRPPAGPSLIMVV